MTFYTPDRLLAGMKRTPIVLNGLLHDVSQERAASATDGPGGWSVVEIVCHLRDFDGFFRGRAELMLTGENPMLPAYDHLSIAVERDYAHQDLRAALATLAEERRRFVTLLSGLDADQWQRGGVHPEAGPMRVIDSAFQVVLHDLDHAQQIARCLGLAMASDGI